MIMVQAYKNYWRKYLDFSGRACLADFWLVVFDNILLTVVVLLLTGGSIWGLAQQLLHNDVSGIGLGVVGIAALALIISLFYGLATIIPNLSLQYRRILDTGLSARWFALPVVAWVLVIAYAIFQNGLLLLALAVVELVLLVINLAGTNRFSHKC